MCSGERYFTEEEKYDAVILLKIRDVEFHN